MDTSEVEIIIGCLREGHHEDAVSKLGPLLASHWRSPAVCHLAGNTYLWQGLAAAENNDLKKAADCWDVAIPHLVVAFHNDSYLAHFAEARGKDYNESLTVAETADGVKATHAFIEEQLKDLDRRSSEAADEFQTQRLQQLYVSWRLELEAAERVRRLGGVPDGLVPARCMALGPKFAARYGLTHTVLEYLEQFQTPTRSPLETMFAEVIGADGGLSTARQEALYCFSDLALPFVYHLLDQPGIALDMLKSVGETEGDPASMSSAAALRKEASELAIRIQIALGTAELRRVRCDPEVVFDQFCAALDAAQRSDQRLFAVTTPVWHLRQTVGEAITSRIEQLKDSYDWDRALRLAKVLARLDPTKQRVAEIVGLLVAQAHWCFGKEDTRTAIDCLQRAEMLAPDDQQVRVLLLICLGKKLNDLAENNKHLDAANTCMEIIEEVRSAKKIEGGQQKLDSELKDVAGRAEAHAVGSLIGLLEALTDRFDEEFIHRAHAYIYDAVKGGLEGVSVAEGSRLANQAISLFNEQDWGAAYISINKALTALPHESQILQLYENLTAAIIFKLCESGHVDRAEEIAGVASARIPESKALERARGRISLCRLDQVKLVSRDPEEIAKLIASMDARIQEEKDLEEPKKQASRYAAVIDSELRVERHLVHVDGLVQRGKCASALTLLAEQEYTGLNAAFAGFLRARALRFMGQPEEALALLDELLGRFPFTFLHLEKGRTLSQVGRFDEAEDILLKCQESEPGQSEEGSIIFELGVNAWRGGRDEDAASEMRLASAKGACRLEGLWIQCMALKRLGREDEILPLTAEPSKVGKVTPWESMVLRWLRGEITDDALRAAPRTPPEILELRYWLGEKERAFGDAEEGNRLIRLCLEDTSLGVHHEFQHAQALLLSGQIGGSP